MPTKPLDRLLFAQGGLCFFCKEHLDPSEASVEHLVAIANGGPNGDGNCVACCKSLNALLGRKSLKEKLEVVLNQRGVFKCPNSKRKVKRSGTTPQETLERVIADLKKRGKARPGSVAKLTSTINNLFQKTLSTKQLDGIIEKLKADGLVVVDGTKVTYGLPIASA
jgi:hypothetical protein